jgi:hypothetical protein
MSIVVVKGSGYAYAKREEWVSVNLTAEVGSQSSEVRSVLIFQSNTPHTSHLTPHTSYLIPDT